MQYITDEEKNITHVVVPIEEWNRLTGSRQKPTSIENPYSSAVAYLDEIIDVEGLEGNNHKKILTTYPTLNMLKNILEDEKFKMTHQSKRGLMPWLDKILFPKMYSFSGKQNLNNLNARNFAINYIMRNHEFYMALVNSQDKITKRDESIFKKYGFQIHKFKEEADSELLDILYNKGKEEFIFYATQLTETYFFKSRIDHFFLLSPIKERIRTQADTLRIFLFDIFEALNLLIHKNPELDKLFNDAPLVDYLAVALYPDNTLSGATSRVYKATKEAKKIIESDWTKYVEVDENYKPITHNSFGIISSETIPNK